jgi:hypothetical protein
MTLPSPPSDPTTWCVGSASASASTGASDNPPGHALVECVGPVPLPSGTDALDEPSGDHQCGASTTASTTTLWDTFDTRTCRVCGCTDWTACTGPNDYACWWVQPDLCSSCQDGA